MAPRRARDVLRHPIAQNVIGLYVLQIATFVVPVITLPYVARVLHPDEFGLVMFAQGFAFVLMMCIDWGFTADGVRQVGATRDDPVALAAVVARILGAQLVLIAASLPITAAIFLLVPKFNAHPLYLLLAWIAAAGSGLAPNWYFLGIEKMRLGGLISLAYRFLAAGLIFAFVKGPGDGWVVMALFAGSSVMALVSLGLRMYRHVQILLPRLVDSWSAVRGAGTLFIATIAATLYTSFNVVLVGLFEPATSVAHYGAAERVLRISLAVLGPLGAAVYPRLAVLQAAKRHERARQLLRLTIVAATLVGFLLALVLGVFAPLIIHILFGRQFVSSSAPILRVLVPIIPFSIVGWVSGTWLISLHMDRRVTVIILRAGVFNIALACVLTPLFGPMGTAISVVCAEGVAAAGALLAVLGTRHGPAVGLLARSAPRT